MTVFSEIQMVSWTRNLDQHCYNSVTKVQAKYLHAESKMLMNNEGQRGVVLSCFYAHGFNSGWDSREEGKNGMGRGKQF